MIRHLRGNAVAYFALLVALSGTAYAAVQLPAGSVGTKQLKKKAVKKKKLARNAVSSPKVKNRSLREVDFALGQLPAGPAGPPGPSVAGYAVSRPGFATSLPADGSHGTTVTLNTGSENSGPINVDFPARLLATGTTRMQNVNSGVRAMRCRLVLNPGPGAQPISPESSASVDSLAGHTATVTGAADVPPGSYNVGMECATLNANSGGLYSDVGLTVVAAGR